MLLLSSTCFPFSQRKLKRPLNIPSIVVDDIDTRQRRPTSNEKLLNSRLSLFATNTSTQYQQDQQTDSEFLWDNSACHWWTSLHRDDSNEENPWSMQLSQCSDDLLAKCTMGAAMPNSNDGVHIPDSNLFPYAPVELELEQLLASTGINSGTTIYLPYPCQELHSVTRRYQRIDCMTMEDGAHAHCVCFSDKQVLTPYEAADCLISFNNTKANAALFFSPTTLTTLTPAQTARTLLFDRCDQSIESEMLWMHRNEFVTALGYVNDHANDAERQYQRQQRKLQFYNGQGMLPIHASAWLQPVTHRSLKVDLGGEIDLGVCIEPPHWKMGSDVCSTSRDGCTASVAARNDYEWRVTLASCPAVNLLDYSHLIDTNAEALHVSSPATSSHTNNMTIQIDTIADSVCWNHLLFELLQTDQCTASDDKHADKFEINLREVELVHCNDGDVEFISTGVVGSLRGCRLMDSWLSNDDDAKALSLSNGYCASPPAFLAVPSSYRRGTALRFMSENCKYIPVFPPPQSQPPQLSAIMACHLMNSVPLVSPTYSLGLQLSMEVPAWQHPRAQIACSAARGDHSFDEVYSIHEYMAAVGALTMPMATPAPTPPPSPQVPVTGIYSTETIYTPPSKQKPTLESDAMVVNAAADAVVQGVAEPSNDSTGGHDREINETDSSNPTEMLESVIVITESEDFTDAVTVMETTVSADDGIIKCGNGNVSTDDIVTPTVHTHCSVTDSVQSITPSAEVAVTPVTSVADVRVGTSLPTLSPHTVLVSSFDPSSFCMQLQNNSSARTIHDHNQYNSATAVIRSATSTSSIVREDHASASKSVLPTLPLPAPNPSVLTAVPLSLSDASAHDRDTFCPWKQIGVTYVPPLKILMKPEMLERHPLMTSRLLLDCNIACIDAAAMSNTRTEQKGKYISPIDLVVDSLTGICIIDPLKDFSTSHKQVFKQILRQLTYEIHKYKVIYLIICVDELSNIPPPEVYMLLYQAVARYPADIICRTIQPAFLCRCINNICVESAKLMALKYDIMNQEYTSRVFLSRLVPDEVDGGYGAGNEGGCVNNSGFIAHCEFLQFCPMVNLFQAAAVLHRVNLKRLVAPNMTSEAMQSLFLVPEWGAELYDLLHTRL